MRVVFADDDTRYRRLLQAAFRRYPSLDVVGEAKDGAEAVRLAVERMADAVLLDVEMPGVDGFAAALRIRRLRPATQLLLHTAELLDERRQTARALDLRLSDKLYLYETLDAIEGSGG